MTSISQAWELSSDECLASRYIFFRRR